MTHNQAVDQEMTRQPVEELRSSAEAARKNSRVRQWRSAQMLAFMRTPVPDEEPMSVDMFSPNTPRLFTPQGNGGSWVKGRTFHPSSFPGEPSRSRGEGTPGGTSSVCPTCGSRAVLGLLHRAREKGSSVFTASPECLFMACVQPVNTVAAGS